MVVGVVEQWIGSVGDHTLDIVYGGGGTGTVSKSTSRKGFGVTYLTFRVFPSSLPNRDFRHFNPCATFRSLFDR